MGKIINMFNNEEELEKERLREKAQDDLYGEAWFILANAYNREHRWMAELDVRDAVDLHDSYDTTKREKYMFKTFQKAICAHINNNAFYRKKRKEKV